ncbi:TRAF-like family protein [Citrus sinensis]|nr:TRAF-like family protein [Citrus sinensis]
MENKFVGQVAISRSISHVPPAHFLLKIEVFSSLVENEGEKYESLEFDAGGYKWKLVVYPNGNKNENVKDHISVYLAMVDTSSLGLGWEVYVIFRLFVLDQKKDEFLILQASICKYVWKIENFSKLEAKFYESEVFVAGDQKWKIRLYPKGQGQRTGSHLSMFLALADSSTVTRDFKICVRYTLRIRDQLQSKHNDKIARTWIRPSIGARGWLQFVELSYLNKASNGLLVHDVCIVEAEVSVLGISKAL